ncbi:hypothetical protein Brms1b_000148 [Colletotrichum noveboracense]|nr:hypothetical protein COL940_001235 [Colletotrichum noveboracense]KAJ0325932.1 hypothetical protein Brms1b_000148 [Colletotrichum noveboracense]
MANMGIAQKGLIQYILADYEEYLAFIRRQTNRFEGVVLVLGNHEFHGLNHDSTIELARRLETEASHSTPR